MPKVRIWELAKELSLDNKALLETLNSLGIAAKSHSSSVDEEAARMVKELVLEERRKKSTPPPAESIPQEEEKKVTPPAREEEKAVEVEPAPAPEGMPKTATVSTPDITTKDLATLLQIKISDLIKELMGMGISATINQRLDLKAATEVAARFGVTLKSEAGRRSEETWEEFLALEEKEVGPNLLPRPPVVTILGHVDHGKTRLLDAIRQTSVIETEAGGITQHIGAYQVEIKGKKVTFLDTPGHEAFTALRARGAMVTDIAVLVVAADDGVKPQTIEAIDHARAAGVPIIVAVNKIDKPEANPDRVKQQLSDLGLVPEEWGGKTVTVPISAKQRQGIEELLEMILLVAEMQELKANSDRPATGVIIEAKLDKNRGPVATVLIRNGTLKVGQAFVAGGSFGKVKAMHSDQGKTLSKATPGMPVEILGAGEVLSPGDIFRVVANERDAKMRADKNRALLAERVARGKLVTLESFSQEAKEGARLDLNLIIKADVQGSLEALTASLGNLSTEKVGVSLIHSQVGDISESDIMLAKASGAIVIGFGVAIPPEIKTLAEREGVDARQYPVIYNALEDVKLAMEGMLEPEFEEVVVGHAEVRQIYRFSKIGIIGGVFVNDGKLVRNGGLRILRGGSEIHTGRLDSLKRFKDDAREVEAGFECGVVVEGFALVPGDIIEAFEKRPKSRAGS